MSYPGEYMKLLRAIKINRMVQKDNCLCEWYEDKPGRVSVVEFLEACYILNQHSLIQWVLKRVGYIT